MLRERVESTGNEPRMNDAAFHFPQVASCIFWGGESERGTLLLPPPPFQPLAHHSSFFLRIEQEPGKEKALPSFLLFPLFAFPSSDSARCIQIPARKRGKRWPKVASQKKKRTGFDAKSFEHEVFFSNEGDSFWKVSRFLIASVDICGRA